MLGFLASFIAVGKYSGTIYTADLKKIHFLHIYKISGPQNKM
jgi:hypothetical protein